MCLMTQDRLTLAHLAGEYGLKTIDGGMAAKKLGLNLRRGAALVAPWQETKLRPLLARMKLEKDFRKSRAARDDEMEYRDYLADAETARLGFSNNEMARQLEPIRKRMQDDQAEDSA